MTRRDTQLVQGTDVALGSAVPLTAPIYNTTTFVFPNARELVAYNEGRSRTYLYSRYENPTVVAVEGTLAALDRAERGLLFSSGMAAVATLLMAHLRSGDEIICAAAVYGGTRRFLSDALAGFGVHVRYASLDELGRVDALVTDRTKVVWFETPVNPTLRCVDVSRLARACRSSGALSVIDNTFASPINQQPLPMGVDLVVQSVTKYLNGHSDVMGGVVTGSEHLLRPIEQMRRLFGTVLGPQAAAALGRGLKTLSIRVCRQNASAGQVASCLDGDRRVDLLQVIGCRRFQTRRQKCSAGIRQLIDVHPQPQSAVLRRPAQRRTCASRPRRPLAQSVRENRRWKNGSGPIVFAGGAGLRPTDVDQTRGEPGRRGQPGQHARPDLALEAEREGAR